jgi:hypothetical protein
MQSLSSQRTIAREGVRLPQGTQMIQLIEPGGNDQDLPAFYIILETSGLANPLNLLEEMTELGEAVLFDSTVTLVDALNLDATLADSPIAADQIRVADVIVFQPVTIIASALPLSSPNFSGQISTIFREAVCLRLPDQNQQKLKS